MSVVETRPELAPPGSTVRGRRPWLAVALAVVLSLVYLPWWFGRVTSELRAYARARQDERLAGAVPGAARLAVAAGWLLIVPAAIEIVRTARRVQRAEELCFATARPVAGLIALVAACQTLGLVVALSTGAAIAAPVSVAVAGVAAVALLQPRLNRLWDVRFDLREDTEPPADHAIPLLPPRVRRVIVDPWDRSDWGPTVLVLGGLVVLFFIGLGVAGLAQLLAAEDRTGLPAGIVTAVLVVGLLAAASMLVGGSVRRLADGRASRWWAAVRSEPADWPLVAVAAFGSAAGIAWLWTARPLFHGLLMPLYQWPLVTWIPLVLGLLFMTGCALIDMAADRDTWSGLVFGIVWRVPVTIVVWGVLMVALPGWQGRAMYEATTYIPTDLPRTTQPRLLPKVAAEAYAATGTLRDAHLVVDPSSKRLVWSAERADGLLRRSPSRWVAEQPLDRVDGTRRPVAGGFDPTVSRVGPGSLQWRAYKRHWFTRVQDAVLVPLAGGGAVAVAPYVGYRGFPVRHPYWAGVYVYHQDGRLEDLTPREAMARPELAASGRLYPERLARAVAAAYGYRTGAGAELDDRPRTEVDDASGNPQPYLTNLGDGQVRWVTVAHPAGDQRTVSAIFLTDSSTGATQIWRPPRGSRLLANTGAAELVRRRPLEWESCCDGDGDTYWVRKVVEPTPVFAGGRLYYVVSVVPNPYHLETPEPVDETVVVDAARARIVGEYDHADPSADARLQAFFDRAAAAPG